MSFFTDFYNKVFSFFKPQENPESNVKDVARSRLKLVLMQDRTNLTPKILEQMRGELIDLLSKYVELDKDLLELNFEQEGDQVALMLSIPVIRAKDEKEIEEALKKDALIKGIQLAEDEEDIEEIEESAETNNNDNENSSEETIDNSANTELCNETEESVETENNSESSADNDTSNEEHENNNEKEENQEQNTSSN